MKYLISILFFFGSVVSAQLTDSLKAYWNFDESSGNLIDLAGANDGTVSGATQSASGKIGTAYNFDGSNDYITTVDGADLRAGFSDISIGGWIYVESYPDFGQVEYIIGAEDYGLAFGLTYTGRTVVSEYYSGDAPFSTLCDSIELNTWTYVGFAFNSGISTSNLTYYTNASTQTTTYNIDFTEGASSMFIGAANAGARFFDGSIDELGFWKRILSASEFTQLYNSGSGRTYPFGGSSYSPVVGRDVKIYASGTEKKPYKNGILKYFNAPLFTATEPSFLTMYDGTCPASTDRYEDYDCADLDFTFWAANSIKDTTDYSAVIHIDPTASDPSEDGTIAHPYNSWNDVDFVVDYAYVQKRGTTFTSNDSITIGATKDDMFFGAYGAGADPIIICSTIARPTFHVYGSDIQFQGLEIRGGGDSEHGSTTGIGIIYARGGSNNILVYDCVLQEGFQGFMSWSSNFRLIDIEFKNLWDDGVWSSEFTFGEISHCNIHDVNTRYLTDKANAGGDGVQLEYDWREVWIHHTTIDRSNSGNKFCILASSDATYTGPYCERGIYEFNTMYGPKMDTDSYQEGAVININYGEKQLIQYNYMEGTAGTSNRNMAIWAESRYDSIIGNVIRGFHRGIIGGSSNNVKVSHNTFYDITTLFDGLNFNAHNNIIYLLAGQVLDSSPSVEDQNLLKGATPWPNSFTGEPDFTNIAGDNFHLQSTSDAIDQGAVLDYYEFDKDKKVITGTPDVGAYEY